MDGISSSENGEVIAVVDLIVGEPKLRIGVGVARIKRELVVVDVVRDLEDGDRHLHTCGVEPCVDLIVLRGHTICVLD